MVVEKNVRISERFFDNHYNLANLCIRLQLKKEAMQGGIDRAVGLWEKVLEMGRKTKTQKIILPKQKRYLIGIHLKNRILVQDRGGASFRTGGIPSCMSRI